MRDVLDLSSASFLRALPSLEFKYLFNFCNLFLLLALLSFASFVNSSTVPLPLAYAFIFLGSFSLSSLAFIFVLSLVCSTNKDLIGVLLNEASCPPFPTSPRLASGLVPSTLSDVVLTVPLGPLSPPTVVPPPACGSSLGLVLPLFGSDFASNKSPCASSTLARYLLIFNFVSLDTLGLFPNFASSCLTIGSVISLPTTRFRTGALAETPSLSNNPSVITLGSRPARVAINSSLYCGPDVTGSVVSGRAVSILA